MKPCQKCNNTPTKVRLFHVGNLETATTMIRWVVGGRESDLCHGCSDRWLETRNRAVAKAHTEYAKTKRKTAWFDYRDMAVSASFIEFTKSERMIAA